MKRFFYVLCAIALLMTMMVFGKPYKSTRAYAPGVEYLQ